MDQIYDFLVDPEDSGRRMDALLADLLPDCSRSFLQKLIEKGAVTVNGVPR